MLGGNVGAWTLAPFVGWFVAGSTKFCLNSLRSRSPAWKQVGYGGMPSTHTSIVSTTAFLIGLRDGWNSAAFAAAAALGFIVILDAVSLRRQIGAQAERLNALLAADTTRPPLRERVGHRGTEVLGGLVVGIVCAAGLNRLL